MKKKIFPFIVALVLLSGLIAGCTSTPDPEPTAQLFDAGNMPEAEKTIEPTVKPEPKPIDWSSALPSGIAYGGLEAAIDDYVKKQDGKMAAVSISVFTKDNILLEKAYGQTDIEGSVTNNTDAVFEWASITKTFVWVSAMQLYEQGKLDLNADIRTYLPEGFFSLPLYDEPITMLHLMNHTSGWINLSDSEISVKYRDGEYEGVFAEDLRKLEKIQPDKPGVRQQYNNYSAAIAGYVIECVSGVPFWKYIHSNIIKPLGMEQTALKPDLSDNIWVKNQREKLRCYTYNESSGLTGLGDALFMRPLYPAGQAAGTISDLRIYGQALLPDENGTSVLFQNTETLAELYIPTFIPAEGSEDFQVCHGFFMMPYFVNDLVYHSGGSNGCTSFLIMDIESGVGLAVLMNRRESSGIEEVFDKVFGAEKTDDTAQDINFGGSAEAVESGVSITWTPEDETTGYWIFRSIYERGLGTQLNEKPATGGEYVDETDASEDLYYYTIVKAGSDPAKGIRAIYRK